MSNKLKILVGVVQVITDKSLKDVADSISYGRAHLGREMVNGNKKLEALILDKYRSELQEFFGKTANELLDPEVEYTKKTPVKIVDMNSLLVQNSLEKKAMLRVLLRSQAEMLATQTGKDVTEVLQRMTEAVRDEIGGEFDEL